VPLDEAPGLTAAGVGEQLVKKNNDIRNIGRNTDFARMREYLLENLFYINNHFLKGLDVKRTGNKKAGQFPSACFSNARNFYGVSATLKAW
jgi:hypothetical protein